MDYINLTDEDYINREKDRKITDLINLLRIRNLDIHSLKEDIKQKDKTIENNQIIIKDLQNKNNLINKSSLILLIKIGVITWFICQNFHKDALFLIFRTFIINFIFGMI